MAASSSFPRTQTLQGGHSRHPHASFLTQEIELQFEPSTIIRNTERGRRCDAGMIRGSIGGHKLKGIALLWWRWLLAVSVGVMVFGIGMVLLPGLTRQFFGLLAFSSSEGLSTFSRPAVTYITLAHGIIGAVMFGWGTAMLLIVLGPLRRASFHAWLALAIPVAAWFIVDTTLSLWLGFWHNTILNTVFLVLFAIPLAATYRLCRTAPLNSRQT